MDRNYLGEVNLEKAMNEEGVNLEKIKFLIRMKANPHLYNENLWNSLEVICNSEYINLEIIKVKIKNK